MAVNKTLMAQLLKLEGAVTERHNVHSTVISTKSPSFNFVFGKGWGLPLGYTLVLYGPPKGGKSVCANAMIAQMHADYPDAVAIKFDTEARENGQMSEQDAKLWGIDLDRYICYSVNNPEFIFDRIEKDLVDKIQKGVEIRLVIIDSLTGIKGRRAMNQTTIMTQQIGDLALTLQEGLKQILMVQRKCKFALVLTAQVRAEMDQLEQRRGNKFKMAASFGVQHHGEYFCYVEADRNKDSKEDMAGNKFLDENLTDLNDNAERTGHKIRFCLKDSSMGPKGRCGEFTFDYAKGIINTHEEVFLLGVNRKVIDHPNNSAYEFKGRKWTGKQSMLQAIKDDSELRNGILQELKERDLKGMFENDPQDVAVEVPAMEDVGLKIN
jgi:RecA/RadA recombinase